METIISIISITTATLIGAYALKVTKDISNVEHKRKFYENVQAWYKETSEIINALYYDKKLNISTMDENTLLRKLSGQIDQGRLYFNNLVDKSLHEDKPDLFKGYKPAVLKMPILIYDLYSKNLDEKYPEAIENTIRCFTSEVSTYLIEGNNSKTIKKYKKFDINNVISIDNLQNDKYADFFNDRNYMAQLIDFKPKKEHKILNKRKQKENLKSQYNQILNKRSSDNKNNNTEEDTLSK